ncbi:DUF6660 family protein [Dyadobacter sediminis]|uniref:DUF2946 domain-containing protein n=1 Tax=Dyadobacter sediminis TaxID=1493691 RepID=A0A5R9KKJ9_9BACT|nr:DUF6660 family protein [Dyadobacter sediminis]TLU96750.1 hypothetical protein FEM55_06405 [Dyadobacter sediminis]
MKNLIVILSVYMLLLSLLPCGDPAECKDEKQAVAFSSNTHADHDNHSENCPPFCSCTCCGQFLSIFTAHSFLVKTVALPAMGKAFYQDFYSGLIPSAIWQPPQTDLNLTV